MVFSDPIFLLLFLPAFLLIYFVTRGALQLGVIILFSIAFYVIGEWLYTLVLFFVLYITILYVILHQAKPERKVMAPLSIGLILGTLILFKYTDFLAQQFGLDGPWTKIHLPLGISFFSFQAISLIIDLNRDVDRYDVTPARIVAYITMFPQLVAGPIVRYSDIAKDIIKPQINLRNIVNGFFLFCFGLTKKVLIADVLAEFADASFDNVFQISTSQAWIGLVSYTFQILFDFAGYSLMAIGIGLMLGFRFPDNFDRPYGSLSITEFWRRWHMTLSGWFRDYLYIPMGGNRAGKLRTYLNLYTVFILCGLWHGASLNFLIWGLIHGTLLVVERMGLGQKIEVLPKIMRVAYTMFWVAFAWVFFRADDLPLSLEYLKRLAIPTSVGEYLAYPAISHEYLIALAAAFLICLNRRWTRDALLGVLVDRQHPTRAVPMIALSVVLLSFCLVKVLAGSYTTFIYFRF